MNKKDSSSFSFYKNIFLIKLLFVFVLVSISSFEAFCKVTPTELKCEYRTNPLGVDNASPRFGWILSESENIRGQKQTAYQIIVASSQANLMNNKGDVWDSGKTVSNSSVNNVYQGKKLVSSKFYFWKVRIWDMAGKVTTWSEHAKFATGLFEAKDWKGDWILKGDQKKTDHNWYRKNFNLAESPSSALVYVASFGYHELYVNGQKVTENVMNPVMSHMKTRIPYLSYDISNKLKKGDNVIAIWHAAGWARWQRIKEYKNPPFVFKAQANLTVNGQQVSISTDETWKCKKSNSEYYGDWDILHFGGETIDDSRKEDHWNAVNYDDSAWVNAIIYKASDDKNQNSLPVVKEDIPVKNNDLNPIHAVITAELSSQMVEPQVRFEEVKPINVKKNADGTYIIDMGTNYTGFFEMNMYNGSKGDSVLFEISDQTQKVMNWNQKSKYIYGNTGEGTFSNRFNVAGGRWITVYGLKYTPKLTDIKGYVITNDRKRISKFECSNELLNQIYEINLDTYIANTMEGILVDCPHRERRGWGEVTVAAMYGDALPNFESGAYMDQYTQFMRDAQSNDGQINAVINENDRPFLMWKANSPITVWETYRMYGDKKILIDNYESMTKWMTWLLNNSNYRTGGALITGKQGVMSFPGLGDWCTPKGNFWTSSNSPEANHFNNSLYAYMLENAVLIANALGKTEDSKNFADRLRVQRAATHAMTYNAATGKYGNGQQINQAFALIGGITPESEKEKVKDALVNNMLYDFPYYDTGSSGQALYTRYFTEFGERMDLIYELLKDRHHPSYGYFIEQGETTWPERWSSVGMSKIHTCYTGIGGYFVKGFGGIRPDDKAPGMKSIIIKPALVGDLTFANTEYKSLYGNVVVNWSKNKNSATFHIEIPANTTANIYLPAHNKEAIKEGGALAEKVKGIKCLGNEKSEAVGNYVIYNVPSGTYNFEVSSLPTATLPEPQSTPKNLSLMARVNASSMFIETEKLPGFEAFKANDEIDSTSWQSNDSKNQYLELEWLKPQTFNKVELNELGNNIATYKIQIWNNTEWLDIASDLKCGKMKIHEFDTITATKCRLFIENASKAPSISEFKVFNEQ